MGRYDKKRVLITGGSSGIGFATAKMLLEQGARVLVTGRAQDSLDDVREQLGPNSTVLKSDAASLSDIDVLASRVASDFGMLDALLICAGQTRFVPIESVSEALFDEMLSVNTKGPYFTVQKMTPLMAEGSAVVFITSVADVKGIPMISVYAASKAALRSMVRSFASELLPRDIRVNAVSPGPIDSGILDKTMSREDAARTKQQMIESNPMKRFGQPDEIAKALIFLAFEATFTTGAEIVVDGGATQI